MNFCTYFDGNYILRFLSLYYSLKKFNFEFNFYILTLDEKATSFFDNKNFENVFIIKIQEIEQCYPELLNAKKNRSLIEYYFTLSPFLPMFIRQRYGLEILSYLDADFYFFKNPKNFILKNIFENSVVLIKQNSHPKYGFYNMGWIDYNFTYPETLDVIKIWSKQCINWCRDIPLDNKYADQKYLDTWTTSLKKIKILAPNYSCLSPWDDNRVIEKNFDSMKAFHFHGYDLNKNEFTTGFHLYNKIPSKKILEKIFIPYTKELFFLSQKYNLMIGTIRNKTKELNLIFALRKIYSLTKKNLFEDKFIIDLDR